MKKDLPGRGPRQGLRWYFQLFNILHIKSNSWYHNKTPVDAGQGFFEFASFLELKRFLIETRILLWITLKGLISRYHLLDKGSFDFF